MTNDISLPWKCWSTGSSFAISCALCGATCAIRDMAGTVDACEDDLSSRVAPSGMACSDNEHYGLRHIIVNAAIAGNPERVVTFRSANAHRSLVVPIVGVVGSSRRAR